MQEMNTLVTSAVGAARCFYWTGNLVPSSDLEDVQGFETSEGGGDFRSNYFKTNFTKDT